MKRVVAFLVILLLSIPSASCASEPPTPSANYLLPLEFTSIDELKNEKDRRADTSYKEPDHQDLKGVGYIYVIENPSVNVKIEGYTVNKAYTTTRYIYDGIYAKYFDKFADLRMTNEELSRLSLVAHRNYGQKEFEVYLNQNSNVGKMIELENKVKVHCEEAKYKNELLGKSYWFVIQEQLFNIAAPGIIQDEEVFRMINSISKIEIDY